MTKNTEPQAFPSNQNCVGMSLRDYFAAKAMQGLIACPEWRENAGDDVGMDASDYTAKAAYEMADAMLKARKA